MTQRNDKQLTQDRATDPLPLEAQHTPGPWIVVSGSVYKQCEDVLVPIAKMDRDIETPTTPTERDANAKLIASAPALLEALRNLTLLIRTVDNVYQDNPAKWLIGKDAFKSAEKAIRDAEGKI